MYKEYDFLRDHEGMKKFLKLMIFFVVCFADAYGMEWDRYNTKKIIPLPFVSAVELPSVIQDSRYVCFLQNNMIALANDHECVIYNHKTGDTITIGTALAIRDLATDSTRTHLALLGHGKDIRYDIETQKKWDQIVSLNVSNITFFTDPYGNVGAWHLLDDGLWEGQNSIVYNQFAKKILFLTSHKDIQKLSFVGFDNQRKDVELWRARYLLSADYSPDGKYIVAMDKILGSLICKVDRSYRELLLTKNISKFDKPNYAFRCVPRHIASAFHPNNKVLAVLSHKNRLEYWNIEKRVLLVRILLEKFDCLETKRFVEKRLSFSPDGKLMCVALKNKCFLLKVPFEVFFPIGTKEKLWEFYKSIVFYKNENIPADIFFVVLQQYLALE